MFIRRGTPLPVMPAALLFFLVFFLKPYIVFSAQLKSDSDTAVTVDVDAYVDGVFKEIKDKGRFVNALSSEDMGALPVGLVREINGKVYVIAIDSARMTTSGAYFNAYFRFTFPGTTKELVFGGKNIGFTPGGISVASSTKLVLLNDQLININDHLDLLFPGNGSNYVEWDCNGFKAANLIGVFEFDQSMIQPEDPQTDKVRAALQVNVKDLNNIMATIDIPAFHIGGLSDFSFKVKNAVVDMSDIANPGGLIMTSDMLEDPGSPNLWRGFYLQEMEVGLPQQLSSKGGRPKLTVRNFFIDDQGVSGNITAENIIKLGDASAGGWPLSIDKVGLSFSKNKLNGGELGGMMRISFLGEDPLGYDASVNMRGGDTYYSFALKTTADKKYAFFAGDITLSKDSRIQISKTEQDFLPMAVLNGKVTLNKSFLKIDNITFQDLTLSTQKPYVHSGTFDIAISSSSKLSGFPVGIDALHIGISEGKIGIGATVKLNLMNSSDKGFAGSTSFVVTAVQEEEIETVYVKGQAVTKVNTHWKLDKVTVNDIKLAVAVMAFKMNGVLTIFDNHPVYGNGFRGFLEFSIPGPIPKAKATAYFGSKDDYRYWHVDAYIGVTIQITPIFKINGLMGGMSYHMERPPQFDPYDSRNSIDKAGGLKDVNEIFQYVPVKEAGLGFMGGVSLALTVDVVVNANVALEVQFGTDGGFRYAQFDGAGYVLHQALKAKSKSEAGEDESAPIWVKFMMRYDNVNHTFDASSKTYINILGILKGVNDRGLVGEAALHIGPDDWWFYVGRPSEMFGLSIAGLAEVRTYFMMGTKVEDMPPLPQEVSEVFDDVNTDFMAMENSMKSGGGFGFGMHFRAGFKFDYGVYGEFAIGAGSDILLRDYGDARCKGSNSVIGFNGWYASGQAYAFLKGDVGIRAKILGKKRGFSIASLSAAVLLQAKFPNPSWFRGMVGVKYAILGGMIKGSANIKVELGSQCELVSAKELNIAIISDIKPDDKTSGVSVFATPQVAFNMPVQKPFSMLNNNDEVATYRIQLDELKLLKDKTEITGTATVSAEGTSASLTLRDILPPVSTLTASAKVHVERQNGGSWDALKEDFEVKSVSFSTGAAPDYIPWENVAYSYPVKRQYNYLPKEYTKGYIKLKRGQPYLFSTVDSTGKKWKVTAALALPVGQSVATTVTYDEAQAQVNFDMSKELTKESVYTFNIVRTSLDGSAAANNVVNKEQTTVSEDGDTTTIAQTALKGNATSAVNKEVISYSFRTSKYNTFVEKMSAATDSKDMFDVATNYISVVGQRFDMEETFDKFEIEGDNTLSTKPLISLMAGTNNSWLQNTIMPLLYTGYPFHPSMTITRDQTITGGIPPLEAVRLYNNGVASLNKLEDAAISEGYAPTLPGSCRFMYYISCVAYTDFHELQDKASRYFVNGGKATPAISKLLTTIYPDLQGNLFYPVEWKYRLPGTNNITSSITRSIYYKL
ncbi:hypothetical protein SAMN05518672_102380 [Chitinophaga sp. CF118]|uniref:hypothetical protein n=1 Tax=Chitinophaga sp. CF118 TaxID=1884367 RepID=UPI0008EFA3B1|nr:hypothetical protein [Chitinophaga sp. CF118]SFD54740.1 hypothetical protein SAMN05518672_102380 [Chitinophaga sp. CF118]